LFQRVGIVDISAIVGVQVFAASRITIKNNIREKN